MSRPQPVAHLGVRGSLVADKPNCCRAYQASDQTQYSVRRAPMFSKPCGNALRDGKIRYLWRPKPIFLCPLVVQRTWSVCELKGMRLPGFSGLPRALRGGCPISASAAALSVRSWPASWRLTSAIGSLQRPPFTRAFRKRQCFVSSSTGACSQDPKNATQFGWTLSARLSLGSDNPCHSPINRQFTWSEDYSSAAR